MYVSALSALALRHKSVMQKFMVPIHASILAAGMLRPCHNVIDLNKGQIFAWLDLWYDHKDNICFELQHQNIINSPLFVNYWCMGWGSHTVKRPLFLIYW